MIIFCLAFSVCQFETEPVKYLDVTFLKTFSYRLDDCFCSAIWYNFYSLLLMTDVMFSEGQDARFDMLSISICWGFFCHNGLLFCSRDAITSGVSFLLSSSWGQDSSMCFIVVQVHLKKLAAIWEISVIAAALCCTPDTKYSHSSQK